ncbi:cache domain-containing protein [Motiliproteus sp. SC1-56]|uniref:cache domain-containing protein n=1 Tax=Motiliproteus sp. SC1-56 TaxID=2799565 RepID=UPI001A8EDC08|nr:cache domain-containing protein [Motiliproteus sp. SC1-56]
MNALHRPAQIISLLILLCLASYSNAVERGSSRQAKLLLDNAIEVMRSQGAEKAFEQFNAPDGGFVQGDLYIFAIDMKGTYFASGANPNLVGQSLAGVSDATGKPIGQEILKLAERIGYGIVEYEWLNRKSNDVEHKFSRIHRVGDYVVGVGFYLPEGGGN